MITFGSDTWLKTNAKPEVDRKLSLVKSLKWEAERTTDVDDHISYPYWDCHCPRAITVTGPAIYTSLRDYSATGGVGDLTLHAPTATCGVGDVTASDKCGNRGSLRVRLSGVWKEVYRERYDYLQGAAYRVEIGGLVRSVYAIGTWICGTQTNSAGGCEHIGHVHSCNFGSTAILDPFNINGHAINSIPFCQSGHPTWAEKCWMYPAVWTDSTCVYGNYQGYDEWWCNSTTKGY
jgi:hypothetical protein